MSVKVGHEGISVSINVQAKDSYGLPVENVVNHPPTPKEEHVQQRTPRGRIVYSGVKVPILQDLDSRYVDKGHTTCRFDIVEKVKTIIKPGSYGPNESGEHIADDMKHVTGNTHHQIGLARHPTFHASFSQNGDEKDIFEKISPYHWNKYVKEGREGDARDVLYRNTYCLERDALRYNTLSLPRISQERPWTVGDIPKESPRLVRSDTNVSSKTILAKQPRGTVVRFREYMRPCTYGSDKKSLEIKRFTDRSHQNHFTTTQNGLPLIRPESKQGSSRPMKFENDRYTRSMRGTLFTKQVVHDPKAYSKLFNRDYSSADTFKEYIECLKNNAGGKTAGVYQRARGDTIRRSIDYNNEVLQSVTDVNQPDSYDEPRAPPASGEPAQEMRNAITVEIKASWKNNDSDSNFDSPRNQSGNANAGGQRAQTIDNLSSVRGSVTHGNVPAGGVPLSSSVVGASSAIEKSPSLPRPATPKGSECPTNTPTPPEAIE